MEVHLEIAEERANRIAIGGGHAPVHQAIRVIPPECHSSELVGLIPGVGMLLLPPTTNALRTGRWDTLESLAGFETVGFEKLFQFPIIIVNLRGLLDRILCYLAI